jgi:CheY-like chemotaxis protein
MYHWFRIWFRLMRMRRGSDALPVLFVPSVELWWIRRGDRMRHSISEPISGPHEGLTASFSVVPIEEIPAPEPSDAASALRPVVLVVDDEPAIADELTDTLAQSGYAAMAAYDAETALETALLVPPDLAVIDARLLESSGIDLATSLREKLPECKIVLISGDTGSSELLATVNAAHLELRSGSEIK